MCLFSPHGDDPTDGLFPGPDGDWWSMTAGAPVAPVRTYAISAARLDAGELDIDFVLHPAKVAGPWVAAAEPGNVFGLNSPTRLYSLPSDKHVARGVEMPAGDSVLTE